jgi:hypothetical protein
MKTQKRKARRIVDRPAKASKKKSHYKYDPGSEKELLDKVVEIIVKIVLREVGM